MSSAASAACSMPSERVSLSAAEAMSTVSLEGGGLTPELTGLIKRTFRGVYLLAFLKREELNETDRKQDFARAVEAAKIAQSETLATQEPNTAALDAPSGTGSGVAGA